MWTRFADRRTPAIVTALDSTSVTAEPTEAADDYPSWNGGATRSARRIAMGARREQDRRQHGW